MRYTIEVGESIGRGQWSKSGVPHKGWTCVDIEDLGEPRETCAMCETQIRFIHHMTHPDYPESLAVGCICAGHMEGDYAAARQRENQLRKTSTRRSRWLTRKWRTSSQGNHFLNTDGYNIVVFSKWNGMGFRINTPDGRSLFSRSSYPTLERAKLAAFEALTKTGPTLMSEARQ
jgi:hypothetical protein